MNLRREISVVGSVLMALGVLGLFASQDAAAARLPTGVGSSVSGEVKPASAALPVEKSDAYGVYGWVSKSYLSAHPAYLTSRAASAAKLFARTSARHSAVPATANKCSGPVCISVIGSGLKVDQWNTTAVGNVGCTEASYIRNGSTAFVSDPICPSSDFDGVYYYYTNPDQNYSQNTKLCNTWDWFVGQPCATVKR